jgi:hypothetical protein
MNQSQKITRDIVALVLKGVEEEYDCEINEEAILRGIADAYLAFASCGNAKDEAKDLLCDLIDQLNDVAQAP